MLGSPGTPAATIANPPGSTGRHRPTTSGYTIPMSPRPAAALLALIACATLLAACASGAADPLSSPTARPAPSVRPTSSPVPAVTIVPANDPTETPDAGTAAAAVCPNPYVTPIAPSPTPDLASTPGEGTATPIRIRRTDITPAPPPPVASATPVPPPLALVPAPDLEQALKQRLGDQAQHYALVVQDLDDGSGVAINADHVFYAASLFKLEVLYDVFAQRDAGLLDFGERYVATDYYSGFDLGPHLVQPCSTATVADLLSAMTCVSDNVAAVMLQDRAGAANINDAMAALGLTDTRLTADGTLPATAADMARLVDAIFRGRGLAPGSAGQMLDLMTHEQSADRIPADLPPATRVAHKTGNWDTATHDAGIVYGPHGTYLMVLMSDQGFASDAAPTEAALAKIAYDYFEGTR